MFAPQSSNTTRTYRNRVTVNGGDVPAGTFSGNETLSAYLYVGDATAALATITAAWDTSNGPSPAVEGQPLVAWTVTPTILAAISNFEPGLYRYQVVCNPDTDKLELARGFVQFEGGAAALTSPSYYTTADGLKVYGTFDDMLLVADWLPNLVADKPSMRSNLSEFRARARRWIDTNLLSRAERDLQLQKEAHAPVVAADALSITTGLDAGPEWGPSVYGDPDVSEARTTISGYLAADLLSLADGEIRTIAANRAVYEVCRSQIGNIKGGETPYQDFGASCAITARNLMAGHVAVIEPDDDQPTVWLRP